MDNTIFCIFVVVVLFTTFVHGGVLIV